MPEYPIPVLIGATSPTFTSLREIVYYWKGPPDVLVLVSELENGIWRALYWTTATAKATSWAHEDAAAACLACDGVGGPYAVRCYTLLPRL